MKRYSLRWRVKGLDRSTLGVTYEHEPLIHITSLWQSGTGCWGCTSQFPTHHALHDFIYEMLKQFLQNNRENKDQSIDYSEKIDSTFGEKLDFFQFIFYSIYLYQPQVDKELNTCY